MHKLLSSAVMAQRTEPSNSLDDFPTPPWGTRALIEHVIRPRNLKDMTCLEPACGRGHMAVTLSEYFGDVTASDVHHYGYGDVADFLGVNYRPRSFDWVITNPPFRLGEEFTIRALEIARVGVAMLTRTTFVESIGRFNRLFNPNPPAYVAEFVERVPMVKGRINARASTATGYAWLVWIRHEERLPRFWWIPPCRKDLERPNDYADAPAPPTEFPPDIGGSPSSAWNRSDE